VCQERARGPDRAHSPAHPTQRDPTHPRRPYLFFSLPLGMTVVTGGVGRLETIDASFSGALSFFGFFVILLLRCSPLGMRIS